MKAGGMWNTLHTGEFGLLNGVYLVNSLPDSKQRSDIHCSMLDSVRMQVNAY